MLKKRVNDINPAKKIPLSTEDVKLLGNAWDKTRGYHGNQLVFYLPGMIKYGSLSGRYPAVSLTGDRCQLQCEHCKGKLLEPMVKVTCPDELFTVALRLARNGAAGLLLTGGADRQGNLPWMKYGRIIKEISKKTDLIMTAHTGFPDFQSCAALKEAGIKQALIDVMGDSDTARTIYHLDSIDRVITSLEILRKNGIQLAPHIVVGLKYGRIGSEEKALEIISRYKPQVLVFVVLTPMKGTPMETITAPPPLEVARLIARARLLMPTTPISLGCERPRNRDGWLLEDLAIRAGITRMAVWSDHAVRTAINHGLEIKFQSTCCSLPFSEELCFAPHQI